MSVLRKVPSRARSLSLILIHSQRYLRLLENEIVIKGPKEAEGSFTDSVKKLWKSGSGKVKVLFAKKGDKAERKPRKAVEDDEDEDDGEGEEFFPEKAKAARPSATGRKSGEKEEDYE